MERKKSYIMWKTKDHDARNTEDITRLEDYYEENRTKLSDS